MPEAASHRSWSQHSGNTPLDAARSQGHDEIVTLLERAESWLHGGVNGSSSVGAALSITNVNGALCHWRHDAAMKIGTERLRNCVIFWIEDLIWCWCWACWAIHVSHTQKRYEKQHIFAWRVALWSSLGCSDTFRHQALQTFKLLEFPFSHFVCLKGLESHVLRGWNQIWFHKLLSPHAIGACYDTMRNHVAATDSHMSFTPSQTLSNLAAVPFQVNHGFWRRGLSLGNLCTQLHGCVNGSNLFEASSGLAAADTWRWFRFQHGLKFQ